MLVIPVLRLVSSLFLLLPTETNYFTRSLSSIFISRALQRWGERQMPRFSAWLSPLNRHPPASSFYFCAPPQVCLCCFLLSSAFLFLFSLFFPNGGRGRRSERTGNSCIRRSAVEGGQRMAPLICWCSCIIHPRGSLITSTAHKCGRN